MHNSKDQSRTVDDKMDTTLKDQTEGEQVESESGDGDRESGGAGWKYSDAEIRQGDEEFDS